MIGGPEGGVIFELYIWGCALVGLLVTAGMWWEERPEYWWQPVVLFLMSSVVAPLLLLIGIIEVVHRIWLWKP